MCMLHSDMYVACARVGTSADDHWVSVDTSAKPNFDTAWYGGQMKVQAPGNQTQMHCLDPESTFLPPPPPTHTPTHALHWKTVHFNPSDLRMFWCHWSPSSLFDVKMFACSCLDEQCNIHPPPPFPLLIVSLLAEDALPEI